MENPAENFEYGGDELEFDADSRINIDYFIKLAIQQVLFVMSQQIPLNDKIITQRVLVENLHSLVKSRGYLESDFDSQITTFIETGEYTSVDEMTQIAKLSNKKFELIMTSLSKRQPITSALKY